MLLRFARALRFGDANTPLSGMQYEPPRETHVATWQARATPSSSRTIRVRNFAPPQGIQFL